MKFLRLLKNDFQRAVFSYRFLFSTIAVTFLVVTSGYSWYGGIGIELAQSIPFLLLTALRASGTEMLMLCVLPLIPFSTSFAAEWKEHSYLFYISRSGPQRYLISKMVISAVSGFLVLLVGVSLSIPIFKLITPHVPLAVPDEVVFEFLEQLWSEGSYFWGYVALIVNYALCACFTTVCAVWFSVYVPNPLATYGAPLLFNFLLVRIDTIATFDGIFAKFPFFNPTYLLNMDYATTSAAVQLGMKMGNILLLSFIMGFFAVRKIKRRVLNG